jgi:hypothetical protein
MTPTQCRSRLFQDGWRLLRSTLQGIHKVLVGNKRDLAKWRVVQGVDGFELAQKLGMWFYHSSAKTGQMVKETFRYMAEKFLMENSKEQLMTETEFEAAFPSFDVKSSKSAQKPVSFKTPTLLVHKEVSVTAAQKKKTYIRKPRAYVLYVP